MPALLFNKQIGWAMHGDSSPYLATAENPLTTVVRQNDHRCQEISSDSESYFFHDETYSETY